MSRFFHGSGRDAEVRRSAARAGGCARERVERVLVGSPSPGWVSTETVLSPRARRRRSGRRVGRRGCRGKRAGAGGVHRGVEGHRGRHERVAEVVTVEPGSERVERLRRRPDRRHQPVNDGAQRWVAAPTRYAGGSRVRVGRRAHRAPVRVAEDDEQAEALRGGRRRTRGCRGTRGRGLPATRTDEDVVRLLTEDELEGHARVGAADHGREGDVVGRRVRRRRGRRPAPRSASRAAPPPRRVAAERVGERLVPPLEERLRRRRGLGRRRRVGDRRVVAPDEPEARRRGRSRAQ